MTEASATAEGDLARTPLAHLLVYTLDRRLTGALFLTVPSGEEHVVRLVRGAPVKVRPGDQFSPLGEMLVAAGAIDDKTLEAALATKGLLGDVLLLAGRVERDVLEKVAEEQFTKRMVRLFSLPPETTYRYYDGHEALAEYGGDPACVDPLALLWAGIRVHGDVSVMMEQTLARLGETPLRLSPSATVSRFGLDAEEAKLCEELSARPLTLTELCAASFPGLARRFAYALVITRQLEMGTGLLPLGVEVVPASSQRNLPPATAVARMALRSTVHRLGAAAPDAPGDGERGAPPVVGRRPRDRSGPGGAEEPPSSRPEALPPESGVVAVGASPRAPAEGAPEAPATGAANQASAEAAAQGPAEAASPGATAAASVESATLRSGIASVQALRASAPDLEEVEAGPDEVAAALSALAEAEGEIAAVLAPEAPAEAAGSEETAETAAASGTTAPVPPPDIVGEPGPVETAEADAATEKAGDGAAAPADVAEAGTAEAQAAEPEAAEAQAAEPEAAEAPVVEAEGAADAFAGLSPAEIFWLAGECLAERDLEGAVAACEAGRREAPDDPDLTALGVWAQAQLGGADIKALTVQLDEVLGAREDHVEARYYRGMLRKRLGDEAGSLRDLRQVLERSPGHEGASLALAAAEQRQKKKERPSLFGKLFKR